MSYLDLHKLELNEDPYSVSRVIDESHQASPECQLPPYNTLDLDLPDLDIVMPPLECTFDVDTPLIPLPYFEGCIPEFSGSINITSCNADLTVNTITPIGIQQIGDCDYELDGDIQLCVTVPCPTGVTATGEASAGMAGGGTGISVESDIAISNSGPCGVELTGGITITNNIKCPDGTEVDASADITAGPPVNLLGYTITVSPSLDFDVSSAGECQYNLALSGTIGLILGGEGPETVSITVCTGEGPETVSVYVVPTP